VYVRWKHWHQYGFIAGSRAVLVEAIRVDGRPRQRVVAYLASWAKQYDYRMNSYRRERFWRQARRALDKLSLPPDARARIEARLAERVPGFTAEEIAAQEQQAATAMAILRGMGVKL
jgi:hypothetical protein